MRFLDCEVVTPPAKLPVTAPEFIDHARLNGITVGTQPELLVRQLTAATERGENYTRRSFLTQTLRALYVLDRRECCSTLLMVLPRGKVQSVESVESPIGQAVQGWTLTGWNTILLAAPLVAPATVVFKSGYGDEPIDVPMAIKEGILEYATVLYEDRTGARETKYQAGAERTIPRGVQDLWRPYQIEVSG